MSRDNLIETDELDRPANFERKVCADLHGSFSIALASFTNLLKNRVQIVAGLDLVFSVD